MFLEISKRFRRMSEFGGLGEAFVGFFGSGVVYVIAEGWNFRFIKPFKMRWICVFLELG